MYCKVCGRKTKETLGVHYIGGRWLQVKADYCFKHGSYVSAEALREAIEVVPDPTNRSHIRPGLHVLVYLKEDQLLQNLTEGFVRNILTKTFIHPRGVKVRLADGQIGRVQKILN